MGERKISSTTGEFIDEKDVVKEDVGVGEEAAGEEGEGVGSFEAAAGVASAAVLQLSLARVSGWGAVQVDPGYPVVFAVDPTLAFSV